MAETRMLVTLTDAELQALVAGAVKDAVGEVVAKLGNEPDDAVVDAGEAARRLYISPRTLRDYVRTGRITPIVVHQGGPKLYKVGDIRRLLEAK